MNDNTDETNIAAPETTQTLSARATAMLSGLHQTRVKALGDGAKAVCSYCAGHSFPQDKGARDVHLLENGTGNHVHRVAGMREVMCKASGIWSLLAHEGRRASGATTAGEQVDV